MLEKLVTEMLPKLSAARLHFRQPKAISLLLHLGINTWAAGTSRA